MMKMKIKDLEENKEIDGIYLISNVTQGVTGTGAPYLNITLQDATGNIEAKKWSASEADIEFYKARKIVHIKGMVISHNGKLQVKILSEKMLITKKLIYKIMWHHLQSLKIY